MMEAIEERLQDLERLILKQSERIDALEGQLELSRRLVADRTARAMEGSAENGAA